MILPSFLLNIIEQANYYGPKRLSLDLIAIIKKRISRIDCELAKSPEPRWGLPPG